MEGGQDQRDRGEAEETSDAEESTRVQRERECVVDP